MAASSRPSRRLAWRVAIVCLGVVPALLLFAWIERNLALPWLPIEWGWPWIDLAGWSLPARSLWDLTLVLAFGALHSGLAQAPAQRWLAAQVGPEAVRAAYVILTGLSALVLMGLWQHTGVVLWALRLPGMSLHWVSAALFWGLMALALLTLRTLEPPRFLGFSQLHGAPEPAASRLIRTGPYRLVRHPLYSFTLAAFLVAPFMTLDRMLFAGGTLLYLTFGIPLEERRLVQAFGEDYRKYRREVPALLPLPRFWV